MKAINLKTEYLTDPVGIDIQKPRLMWNCEGGIRQTAYRIVAISAMITVWDSGKVNSPSMRAEYPKELISRQRVEWKVQLWDENDAAGDWSETAFFETGLLSADDWRAKWIAGNYRINKKKRYPVDCFKKNFTALGVRKARLYVTACGLYEIKINGERAGNFVLAPGHTDYRKRIQYQTYDVTGLIRGGANVIAAELADGWYRGSCGAWGLKNQYGTQTKLLAQLELYDSDGKITRICTDESWAWSNDGAIRFADNKDGEIVDARKTPSYGGRAKEVKCGVVPSASNNVYVTEHERFAEPKVIKTPSGKTVLDFGQNIAGYISFTVNAKAGQKVTLRFGEMLDKNGELTLKNIQCSNKKIKTPLQKIEYICKDGVNAYKTKFAIFGFQYAEVVGCNIKDARFEAIAVYSDMEETLSFESSNELLNKFVDCTRWSAKNNSADVPTDCPTRERHGWTGDSQIFFTTAAYLFNYAPFAKKHLNDVYDWQKKNGKLPQIAPYGGVDFYMATMNGAPGWADVGILIPYRFYKQYNDAEILRRYYTGMKKYAKFIIGRMGRVSLLSKPLHIKHKYRKYAVNCGQAYGEWAEPVDVRPMHWTDMVFPKPEVATAYASWMMRLMAEIAGVLGQKEDEKKYTFYAEKTKEAYRAIRQTEGYTLDTDRQAMLVRPLYLDLLDEKQRKYAVERLIQAIERYRWRVGTGFLSTPLILDVLADIDIEYAYRLLENEEMPGWLFMPKIGATTIWEGWEGTQAQGSIASLDHYSKGAVLEWVFSKMCGLTVAGENKFRIAPMPGGNFSFAKTEYQSIFGKVSCGWEKTKNGWEYTVSVPANTTAEVILPDGRRKSLIAGEYTF